MSDLSPAPVVTMTSSAEAPAPAAVTNTDAAPFDRKAVHVVVDAKGRRIAVRRMTPLQRVRLLRTVGAEASANQAWLEFAFAAASVVSIDDSPETVATVKEVEAMIARLDEDGIDAMKPVLAKIYNDDATEASAEAGK